MKTFRTLLIFALTFLCIAAQPLAASAFNSYQHVDCSGNKSNSAVCTERSNLKNPVSGDNGLLAGIVNILSYVAGAAAIIVIIVGGIKYTTSGGDSNNTASAKRMVIAALVGLFFIALARTLVIYIVNKL